MKKYYATLALYLRSIIIGFLAAVALLSLTGHITPAQKSPAPAIDNALTRSLKEILPAPHAAFVIGTILGARSELPWTVKEDFARTSTSHITAVSGYNITLIASIIGAILAYCMRRSHAFYLTVAALIGFMIMTGAQASVVRATIMGLYALTARQLGRLPSPTHGLLLTAGIMVMLSPRILAYDIGFQLSFLATAGILYIAPILEARFPRLFAVPMFGEICIITISAQVAVLPLIIYYFHSISLVALPINLIVLPLVPLIMIFGFMAGVIGIAIPLLGTLFASVPHLLSWIVLGVIHAGASLAWGSVPYHVSFLAVVLVYATMGLLIWHLTKEAQDSIV